MAKTIITSQQFKQDMFNLGYHVRLKYYSDFGKAFVCRSDGPINQATVITPEHLTEHAVFYDYAKTHSVKDGDYRFVI